MFRFPKDAARPLGLILLPSVALLAACGSEPAPPPPPTPVEIVTLKAQPVPNIAELPGRIAAVRTAEVRARSDGIILRRLYEEGAAVQAGTPLFTIDPRDYRAQVQSAEAALQRAIAARQNASSIVSRYGPLIEQRAVSAQEYDAARSDMLQATAQVAEARAALDRARLQLSYTTVTAPIAGRAGVASVTEGALVSGAGGTLLTRIDQVSPVYAVFAESSTTILNLTQAVQRGDIKLAKHQQIDVQLLLENGTPYGPVGRVDFASSVVDPQTGTQTIRARFDNPEGLLVPGQFVRGRVFIGSQADGILVPARAVQFKGETATVSLLGKDGSVLSRTIELGPLIGSNWIVKTGLRVGDQVIVEGWQKVQPGQKARAVAPARTAPGATAASSSAAPQPGR